MPTTLRLILGDQLNYQHSWFQQKDDSVLYVLMEIRQETDYVKHHIQKIVGFFSAMRQFARWLESEGHRVKYFRISDADNTQSLTGNLSMLLEAEGVFHFEYQLPDEYRLDQQLTGFCQSLSISSKAVDSEHFLTQRFFLRNFFKGKKQYLMESFYRSMRKKYDLLMEPDGTPTGEKWNFDASNRKKYDPKVVVPAEKGFQHDVSGVLKEIEDAGAAYFGNIEATNFSWPLNRQEAMEVLKHFNQYLLPYFGTFQDAMQTDETFLFHSRLSFALNTKMLSPLEVVQSAISAWQQHPEKISLPQIEGFVRQIIGWREYMRGIYWDKMPEYASLNFFDHQRKLPGFFWTGETNMNCLHHAITNSLDNAYSHHIQRLMVTGNFALLAGIEPSEVDQWYLGIYIDALEWVEITNTRGMSQFADGGIVGTKPYVSSANYIAKMSNYCDGCQYDKKKKYGARACPFNSLYWHFYHRNAEKLEKNPRIGMMYVTWRKMQEEEKKKILQQAEKHLSDMDSL